MTNRVRGINQSKQCPHCGAPLHGPKPKVSPPVPRNTLKVCGACKEAGRKHYGCPRCMRWKEGSLGWEHNTCLKEVCAMTRAEKRAESEKMIEDQLYEPPKEYWKGDGPCAEDE